MTARPALDIGYKPDALHPVYKTVRLQNNLGVDMMNTQNAAEQPVADLTGEQIDALWRKAVTEKHSDTTQEYVRWFARAAIAAHLAQQQKAEQAEVVLPSERAQFEAKIRQLSSGEPDFNSPAAMWAWAAWQERAAIAASLASQSQAAQPSVLRDSDIVSIAEHACLKASRLSTVFDFARAIERTVIHLAGQSQATKVQAPAMQQYADILRIQKAEAETGDTYMRGLYNGMLMMCANIDNVEFSPMPAPTAQEVQGLPGKLTRYEPSGSSGKNYADFPEGLMRQSATGEYYKVADVEAMLAKSAAQEVTQQAAPEAELKRITHERDALAGAIRDAAVKAGIASADACLTGPHLLMMCSDMAECILAPTAQQAAKAETAEQVLTYEEIRNIVVKTFTCGTFTADDEALCRAVEAEVVRRCCAQRTTNNDNGSNIAPTTSTVSAPDEISADTKRIDWLIANHRWSIRWRLKKGAEQWQMVDDGESWGQWGGFRNVLDAAMRTSPNKGEAA